MHRKLLILIVATFFIAHTTTAQSMRWGLKGGSSDSNPSSYQDEEIKDIAADAHGNIYVLANINMGARNIDGSSLPAIGNQSDQDVVLASFKCDGTPRWIKQIGNPRGDIPLAMSLDSRGGGYVAFVSYLTGGGTYDCYVDKDTIIRQNSKVFYLVKYDTAGKYQWIRTPQPDTASSSNSGITGALDMAVNANDEVEIFCILPPGLYGGTGGMVANAVGNYMLRYNANGNFIGGVKMDMFVYGTAGRYTRMVLNKRNGLYYISSRMGVNDTVKIGTNKIINNYIACFDRTGKNIWYEEGKNNSIGANYLFAIDDQSNIYMAGGVADTIGSFGGMKFKMPGNKEYGRPMVIKLDSTGKALWGIESNATSVSSGATAAMLRNSGELIVTGAFGGSLSFPGYPKMLSQSGYFKNFIMSVNTQTGKVMWLDTINNMYDIAAVTALAADERNSVLIGGKFAGEMLINGKRMPKTGGRYDWYIAKYGYTCNCKDIPSSNFMWYRQHNAAASASFSYTGSKYTSIHWDFGDGNTSTAANPTHTYAGIGAYTACVTVRNSCGDHTTCYTLPLWLTDVDDVSKTTVSIYPNPAQQQLTIEGIATGTTLQLVDMLGRVVYRGIATGSKEVINTQSISTGSYILHLSAKDGSRESFRVEKQ